MKNGKNKAHIEIEIVSSQNGDLVTFHRSFDKNSKENFSIDGKGANKKEYLRRIKQFNIQVDNLCMFLPQDRVQDFTKMNPQELLHNTQISVCSQEINETFNKLLELRNSQKNYSNVNADLQTRLDDNRNRNEKLRTLIESNTVKMKLIERVDLFMKKKEWLEYDKINDAFKVIEADLKQLNDRLVKKNDDLKPLLEKQHNLLSRKTAIKNATSKAVTGMNSVVETMLKFQEAIEKTESDVMQAKQNMKNTIDSMRDHKKQVTEMSLLIELERSELNVATLSLHENGNADDKIINCDKEIAAFKSTTEKLMQKRNAITKVLDDNINPSIRLCERKINMLGDTQRQRIQLLRNNNEDTFKAFEWLEANRQNFHGRIFNPVMIEMTVREKENAKYIENTIAGKDLVTFICTNKEDMKQLIKKLRNEMGLQVNLAFSEDTNRVEFAPPYDINDLPPSLGLYTFMIDTIDAPAPVINYLCRLYNIHQVAIGDDRTFENASKVPKEIRVFFSTNHRFQVSVSRYSNAKSTSSSAIHDRNMLNVGVDAHQKEKEERNLLKWKSDAEVKKNARAAIEGEIKKIEDQVALLRNEKNQINGKKHNIKMCTDKLRKKEVEFQQLKNRKINVDEERQKLKNAIDSLVTKFRVINEKRVASLVEYKNFHTQRLSAQKKLEVFENHTGNVDEEIQKLKNEIGTTTSLFERIRDKYNETNRRLKFVETEALKLTDGKRPTDPGFKYKAKFEELSGTLDELNTEIQEMRGRLECMRGMDPKVVNEYEERKKEIEEMESQLGNEHTKLGELASQLKTLHDKWFPTVQNVVKTINQNFSNFFNMMGFVGEVEMVFKEQVS